MKDKNMARLRVAKRTRECARASSKAHSSLDPLDTRAARVITSLVRVLVLMGFNSSFICAEVLRATGSEKVRPMKRLEFDVRDMSRILARWANDPQFISEHGRPLDLPQRGAKVSFESLVRAELPGVDPDDCLNVLLTNKGVIRSKSGLLRWRERAALRVIGNGVVVEDSLRPLQGLLDTLAENMMSSAAGKGAPILEFGVSGFQVEAADVSELCHYAKKHGTLLLEQLDEWLALRERRRRRDAPTGPVLRPYVGLFIASDGGA
jgi:hypothetical protein